MDSKLSPALAKRLAAYSATAGVTLACAPVPDAQVVYFEPRAPVIVECYAPLRLDFDDDLSIDLRIDQKGYLPDECGYTGRTYDYRMVLERPPNAAPPNGVLGYGLPGLPNPDAAAASRLSSGEVIGPPKPGQGFYSYAVLASSLGVPETLPFSDEEGYAGFQFVGSDGEQHFGWVRLFVRESGKVARVYDYAYEATPDTPIVAGARSAALLDGDVSQRVFPPSGGTLVYTFTVENTTDDPLPLDLWVDHYRKPSGPGHTRFLGSGTLPPRATLTRSVSLDVRADARSGKHTVRFRLGDYDTGVFITFERFRIRKEEGTGVMQEVADEPFVAMPVEGDLFAEAEVAEAIVGTHALSAPVPNPSTGETALTLSLAEAQHVSVVVHDALGRRVAVLHEGVLAAGQEHRLMFDGSGLPAGAYAVRAVGEAFSDVRVLTLTR